ncbi:MAG: AAA family ATPase, partial [Anaerolineae bacterium]
MRLHFLGPLDISCGDRKLSKPPTLKSQSLLAYLVLHREHPQPRERLAGLLWGERPERKARRSLTTALWHIRRCLPQDELILSDFHAVQFDPQADLWLDVDEFEAQASHNDIASLQSAAALYRGDFVDGFYDDWIINERYRLETLFLDALARLMVGHEARADHQAALATALRLLGRDPLREDAHRTAMRAYCHLGQRNAALEQYRHCQEVVLGELGTEPMAETTELYQAILEGRFEVRPLREVLPVEVPAIEPVGQSPLDVIAPVKLVGREQELAFLHQCWQGAQTGQGELILIEGEAGVGKTRLLEAFADHLRWQGVRVLWGRCYEFERLLPYQPIAEALRPVLPLVSPAELTGCPPWALGQVARIAPGLRDRHPDVEMVSVARPDQEQGRLFDGILRFLAELARHGVLLIVLEDLHWASESTLALLHFLARHMAEHPALMIGTLRPEELVEGHRLRDLQRRLEREGVAASLRLPRLSLETVKMLVREMSGVREAVDPLAVRLFQETEGNPFFLMELLKALFGEDVIRLEGDRWCADFSQMSRDDFPLPSSVTETIQARVGRLEQDTQEVVRLSAVLGREFDFDPLSAAWACGEETTLAALDDLLRRRVIEEVTDAAGRDYAFTHHKIQEVVYAGMPRRQRQFLHAQVGAAMERVCAPEAQEEAGELAFHFERARRLDPGLTDKAIAYLRQAGDQARQAYAHQEAIDYCLRALALLEEKPPDEAREDRQSEMVAQLYEAVGDMLELTGHHEGARGAYREALARVSRQDPVWQSRLYRRTGKSWEVPLCFEEAAQAYDVAESVLGQKPTEPDRSWWQEWIEVQVDKMWLRYWQRQVHKMAEQAEKVRPTVEQYGTPVQRARFFQVLVLTAQARDRYRATEETIDLARASLSASQELNNPSFIALAQF